MLIREATESDGPGIADLLHGIAELRTVTANTIDDLRTRVAGNLALGIRSPGIAILIAAAERGTIAGYCPVHWIPFLFFSGLEAYITELFVHPSDRGEGAGSRLLEEVRRRAERRGCSRLSLLTGRDSEAYRRGFYAQRQWQERDRMANFIFPLPEPPHPTRPG